MNHGVVHGSAERSVGEVLGYGRVSSTVRDSRFWVMVPEASAPEQSGALPFVRVRKYGKKVLPYQSYTMLVFCCASRFSAMDAQSPIRLIWNELAADFDLARKGLVSHILRRKSPGRSVECALQYLR